MFPGSVTGEGRAASGVGRVFTPLSWAMWLVEVSGALAAWRDGASVLDPTCGEGVFLEAFVALSRRDGIEPTREALSRLHGVEIVPEDKTRALRRIADQHGAVLPGGSITVADFITAALPHRYDVVVGNPPWMNFTDLPEGLKARWGRQFVRYRLVSDRRDVLLGASRADIATLVLKKALDDALSEHGRAAFFIPLSVFFNSGANDRFRPFPMSEHAYRVVRLWDFGDEAVFAGVSTRYGAAEFDRRRPQRWPVETRVRRQGAWTPAFSTAGDRCSGAWRLHDTAQAAVAAVVTAGPVPRPRQGVNTCGASAVFIFEADGAGLRNGLGERCELEQELLFPLMNAANFGRPLRTRPRWILLPHDSASGRPLSWEALLRHARAAAYLTAHRRLLSQRRGTLINSHIGRGAWWALLGVGPYSFAPWKVAWEALGRKTFTPVVLEGRWQGNQALHAYCPCQSLQEAQALAADLARPQVAAWLTSSGMAGTRNWAQPGRIAGMLAALAPDAGASERQRGEREPEPEGQTEAPPPALRGPSL